MDMAALQYVCLPVCVTGLAILFPFKPPLLSALLCKNRDCNFAMRCILIILEFVNMAIVATGAGYHGIVVLVTSISFILSGLKYLKGGIAGYKKLQALEKVVNSVIRDRIFATYGYFVPILQLSLCFIVIKIWQSQGANIVRMAIFICPYLALVTLTLVTFSVAGHIITISTECILKFQGQNNSALTRRVYRSFATLRPFRMTRIFPPLPKDRLSLPIKTHAN